MTINGIDISTYGAVLLGSPRVSPRAVQQDYIVTRNGATFVRTDAAVGLKEIEINVAFLGYTDAHEIQRARSALRAALMGTVELYIPFDGYYYTAVIEESTELESEHSRVAVSRLVFSGIQHDQPEIVRGTEIECMSTVPATGVKVTGTATAESGKICGIPFHGVTIGDTLCVDSINMLLLRNGAPGALNFDLIDFPFLHPGTNYLDCENVDNLSTEFSTTYM